MNMSMTKCFVCGNVEKKDSRWKSPNVVDMDTGKHVHWQCMLDRTDELNEELEYHPCCDKMMSVAGDKISIDIFTETFAVYEPDNHMKYYFNGIRYCPFCGRGIVIKKGDKRIDISAIK